MNTLNIGKYTLKLKDTSFPDLQFRLGGVYAILINLDVSGKLVMNMIQVTDPNSIHMLWMIPQYIIITMGEIMFSITGLEFSYSQAPKTMKSVLQACWLLTTAFGNLLVVIIEAIDPFEKQSANFFLYAGIMMADIVLFAFMASRYKYVEKDEDDSDLDMKPIEDKKDQKGIDNDGFINNKDYS